MKEVLDCSFHISVALVVMDVIVVVIELIKKTTLKHPCFEVKIVTEISCIHQSDEYQRCDQFLSNEDEEGMKEMRKHKLDKSV